MPRLPRRDSMQRYKYTGPCIAGLQDIDITSSSTDALIILRVMFDADLLTSVVGRSGYLCSHSIYFAAPLIYTLFWLFPLLVLLLPLTARP